MKDILKTLKILDFVENVRMNAPNAGQLMFAPIVNLMHIF